MDLLTLNQKASILRKAANAIERNGMEWENFRSCVIGNIAQVILGDLENVDDELTIGEDCWTGISKKYPVCPDTGISISTVITSLYANGFSEKDILRAEFGSDEKYALSLIYRPYDHEDPKSVIFRLREWAEEIDRQVTLTSVARKTEKVIQ